ncbi:MAG: DMT family transporter [Desulfobacterales bacterium]|nr:DMT family transporter [Desulfobacterales bacterium]
MTAVLLSLMACLGWGFADYFGALKSRKLPLIVVLTIPQIIGLFAVIPFLISNLSAGPTPHTILFGSLAGFFGMLGLAALYRGMAIGPIGVVSLIASMCAILPVIFDLALGNRLSTMQTIGIILALASIILLREKNTRTDKSKQKKTGIGYAFVAALGLGLMYIFLDAASNSDPYWTSMVERLTIALLLTVVFLINKPIYKFNRADLPVLAIIGVFNALSTVAFSVASTMGMISIVSVLSSLYPIVPIVLASMLLHERLTLNQIFGVIMALSGIIMVSAGS